MHVVDCTAPDPEGQITAARGARDRRTARRLLAQQVRRVLVDVAADLHARHESSVVVSAQQGQELMISAALADRLRAITAVVELLLCTTVAMCRCRFIAGRGRGDTHSTTRPESAQARL